MGKSHERAGLVASILALAVAMLVDWYVVPWGYPVGSAYALPLIIAALTVRPSWMTALGLVAVASNLGSNVLQGAPPLALVVANLSLLSLAVVAVALARQRRATLRHAQRLDRIRIRQQRIVEGIPLPIVVLDDSGHIVEANPSAYALLGLSPRDESERDVQRIFHGAVPDLLHVGDEWRGEAEVAARDGTAIPVAVYVGRIELPLPATRIVTLRDLRPERELERHRQEWVAILGHELRNPLTPIRGVAQLMQRRRKFDEHGAEIIVRETDRLNRLVSELVDASLAEQHGFRLQREDVDLVELATRCVAEVSAISADRVIGLDARAAEVHGAWDPDRLQQVVMNVLMNAVKHTAPDAAVGVVIERDGEVARIVVRDQGAGIPNEELPHIFERYRRGSAREGLGLGLFVTRALVEAHGGTITASRNEPRGTAFEIVLPVGAPSGIEVAAHSVADRAT